jgi:glycosyltransferase involved in cell wall biosynthesis
MDQTYTDWEIIAIDDHSTDDSLEIVALYAKKDTRIKTYPNQGNGIIQA